MILYSILLIVDFSPTFYCLPKPLFLYGLMVLLSTLVLYPRNYVPHTVVMLGFNWWLCMVINISVQYNGGLLPDIILLTQGYYLHRDICSNTVKKLRILFVAFDPT